MKLFLLAAMAASAAAFAPATTSVCQWGLQIRSVCVMVGIQAYGRS